MPNKQYLLQLGESALLAALVAVYPLLSTGYINWLLLLIVVAFAVAHSLATYIKNADLRTAINNDLTAGQAALPSSWLASAKEPQPIVIDTPPEAK